jgi:hypothetical protein
MERRNISGRVEACQRILQEIHNSSAILKNQCQPKKSDEILQWDSSDKDLTEPVIIILK